MPVTHQLRNLPSETEAFPALFAMAGVCVVQYRCLC